MLVCLAHPRLNLLKIGYMGIVAKQHRNSDGHKSRPRATAVSSRFDIFGVNAKDVDDVVASEIAQIYHAVKHSLSYNSLDCTLKLYSKLYQAPALKN